MPLPKRDHMDLLAENKFKIELEDGDKLKPNCYIDETINSMRIMDAVERELDAIIVKLLGKSLNFYTMRDRL